MNKQEMIRFKERARLVLKECQPSWDGERVCLRSMDFDREGVKQSLSMPDDCDFDTWIDAEHTLREAEQNMATLLIIMDLRKMLWERIAASEHAFLFNGKLIKREEADTTFDALGELVETLWGRINDPYSIMEDGIIEAVVRQSRKGGKL